MPDSVLNLPLGPLMVDVPGTSLTEQDIKLLLQPSVGAVILFSRNYESRQQLIELTKEISQLRSPALLIAVDQEGGRVQRFREGFYKLPSMNSFSATFDEHPKLAYELASTAGELMAAELIEVGIDFSFAPVLDCADLQSKVIGDRGFHHNPFAIAELAGAFIKGMNLAGMSATGKHFPGHGGVIEDSHVDLPVDHRPLSDLESCDLIPFQNLANQLGGIMTAHVAFPQIDDVLPTYSPFWLQTILRQRLGFSGVIFSDDLTMTGAIAGAIGTGTPSQRTELALAAGCDMALICNDPEAANQVASSLNGNHRVDAKRIEVMRKRLTDQPCDTPILKDKLATHLNCK